MFRMSSRVPYFPAARAYSTVKTFRTERADSEFWKVRFILSSKNPYYRYHEPFILSCDEAVEMLGKVYPSRDLVVNHLEITHDIKGTVLIQNFDQPASVAARKVHLFLQNDGRVFCEKIPY